MSSISQKVLLKLAEKWEPDASNSQQTYREATCVVCSRPMHKMWHCWLKEGGFKKEIHVCANCYPIFTE